MTAPVMLDLSAVEAITGIPKKTQNNRIWRARHGLPLSDEARAFARIVHKIGGRLRVSEDDLQAWMRDQPAGSHGPKSDNQIAERARELGNVARACGLDCVSDCMHLAAKIAEEVAP